MQTTLELPVTDAKPTGEAVLAASDGSAHWVWRLTNGKYVHKTCREEYQKRRERGGNRPSIDAAVYQGYAMSRFTLCDHCEAPIWDAPNTEVSHSRPTAGVDDTKTL